MKKLKNLIKKQITNYLLKQENTVPIYTGDKLLSIYIK